MAKKKKTRQQKIIADLRRQLNASTNHVTFSVSNEEKKETPVIQTTFKAPIKRQEIFTNTYPYLVKDLRKTAILSAVIIVLQFLLLFILKAHIFSIDGLIY